MKFCTKALYVSAAALSGYLFLQREREKERGGERQTALFLDRFRFLLADKFNITLISLSHCFRPFRAHFESTCAVSHEKIWPCGNVNGPAGTYLAHYRIRNNLICALLIVRRASGLYFDLPNYGGRLWKRMRWITTASALRWLIRPMLHPIEFRIFYLTNRSWEGVQEIPKHKVLSNILTSRNICEYIFRCEFSAKIYKKSYMNFKKC